MDYSGEITCIEVFAFKFITVIWGLRLMPDVASVLFAVICAAVHINTAFHFLGMEVAVVAFPHNIYFFRISN